MRSDRRNYVIVGAFVVAMAVALLVWIVLISGRTGPTDSYWLVYDNVMGLKAGTRILFEGYPVGLIDEIGPWDDEGRRRFRVDVSVERGWPIPDDSVATIATGIFAAAVIDIESGTSQALLEPGSRVPAREAVDVLAAVNSAADRLSALLDDVSRRTPEMLGNVERFTSEINVAVDQINALIGPENVGRVDRILANLETGTSDVNAMLGQLRKMSSDLTVLIESLDKIIRERRDDISESLIDLRHSLDSVARHIDAITSNLESTTRNLSEFSRQLRDNPGLLIRGRDAGGADPVKP